MKGNLRVNCIDVLNGVINSIEMEVLSPPGEGSTTIMLPEELSAEVGSLVLVTS